MDRRIADRDRIRICWCRGRDRCRLWDRVRHRRLRKCHIRMRLSLRIHRRKLRCTRVETAVALRTVEVECPVRAGRRLRVRQLHIVFERDAAEVRQILAESPDQLLFRARTGHIFNGEPRGPVGFLAESPRILTDLLGCQRDILCPGQRQLHLIRIHQIEIIIVRNEAQAAFHRRTLAEEIQQFIFNAIECPRRVSVQIIHEGFRTSVRRIQTGHRRRETMVLRRHRLIGARGC